MTIAALGLGLLGEPLHQLRELIKDLHYRNRQERIAGELELQRRIELQRKSQCVVTRSSRGHALAVWSPSNGHQTNGGGGQTTVLIEIRCTTR